MNDKFTYHGIEKLSLVSEAITGMYDCTREQLANFEKIKAGSLDEATLVRAKTL